jgi:hypothetical protein
MNKPRFIQLFTFFVLGVLASGNCSTMEIKMDNERINSDNGGFCMYASYEGDAKIVRITQTPTSLAQANVIGGPGYEGYEVWFHFTPNQAIPEDLSRSQISREHLFTLNNGWYVGPRYIEKYGLGPDKTFPCVLMVIVQGTCSPLVFDFKTLDRKDYFESRF